jgi:NAD(P)-dependent dehydrogenase (short-subunit alcohol dehydrogenase family)
VANAIHYLCSDDAGYVTGTELWVTGGQHMY